MTLAQEMVAMEIRRTLWLPLDDLLVVVREFLNPKVSRSRLARLTDNGSQFTDRFTSKTKTPSGRHAFDRECALLGIEHRLTKPRHPQTNGMVERFNGRISDLLATTRFRSHDDPQTTLECYEKLYNEHLPQRTLGHKMPLQAIRTWRKDRPELFVRRLKNQTGLDNQHRA